MFMNLLLSYYVFSYYRVIILGKKLFDVNLVSRVSRTSRYKHLTNYSSVWFITKKEENYEGD